MDDASHPLSDALVRGYPQSLESWWLAEAARRMELADRALLLERLEAVVSDLSDSFTTDRAAGFQAYARTPFAWLAYSLFYAPQTFMRMFWLLQEAAVRLGSVEGRRDREPRRVLDLGAGTGAASAAWLSIRAAPDAVPVELTAVDASDAALDLMEAMVHAQAPAWGEVDLTTHCADLRSEIRRLPGEWDVILVSYALNEAFREASDHDLRSWWRLLADRLSPTGILVVCEPLVLTGVPVVAKLRQWALADGTELHIAGPCQHRYACPMADGATGWCHDVRRWRVADSVQALNRRLFRSVNDLKYSHLMVTKQPVTTGDDAGRARLVAPVTPLKGRWSFTGCAADGCLRTYEVLQRGLDRERRDAIDALERGDIVTFKTPMLLGDGLTYRASL